MLVYFIKIDVAKQRIRAAAARKKKERLAKGTEEGDSSTPKSVNKAPKRKADGDDARPSKKTVVIPGDSSLKGKSSLKPSRGVGKGAMTSSGLIHEGPSCLLTHKAYAVGEVGSFVKPTDLDPCDLVGMEDLGASTLFDITRVCLLFTSSVWFLSPSYLTNVCALLFFRPWFASRLFKNVALPRRRSSPVSGSIMLP